MRRVLALAAALLALALGASTARAGSFTKATLAGHDYYVYTPTGYTGATPVPLVVYLHGCTQTAPDAALGTRWNQQAESSGFVAVYPEQTTAANVGRCWNWAQPNHQQRGSGEPGLIAGVTAAVRANRNVDPKRVYLLGASAGGAMAMVMGATYPDVYAAVGNLAGCGYATCFDGAGYLAYQAMGPRKRQVPLLIGAGTLDPTYLGVSTAVQQWLGTDDLVDDGAYNFSVSRTPSSTESFPVTADSYAFTLQHHTSSSGRRLVTFGTIQGLGHAYPGGDPAGGNVDPKGPALTPYAWGFFTANPMP